MGDMELLPMCGARGTGPNKPNTEDAALQGDYRSQDNIQILIIHLLH